MRQLPRRSSQAFTLVELLVASAVMGILLVLLAQVTNSVSKTWVAGNARTDRRQNARALVDFIGRELRAAALPVNSLAGANKPDLQFMVNANVGQNYLNPHNVFWQVPLASDTTKGDMAEIGYFVRWDTSTAVPKARLCRLFLNPTDSNHQVYSSLNWLSSAVLDAAAPADAVSGYRGLFAENVIGFWARCLDASGTAITSNTPVPGGFDSRASYATKDSAGNAVTVSAPALPTSMEISIVLLDRATAENLTSAMQADIQSLAATTTNAADFMSMLPQKTSLRAILKGAAAHQIRVRLQNAP